MNKRITLLLREAAFLVRFGLLVTAVATAESGRRSTAQQRATRESQEQLLGAAGQTEWQAHADCFELGMLGAGTFEFALL